MHFIEKFLTPTHNVSGASNSVLHHEEDFRTGPLVGLQFYYVILQRRIPKSLVANSTAPHQLANWILFVSAWFVITRISQFR